MIIVLGNTINTGFRCTTFWVNLRMKLVRKATADIHKIAQTTHLSKRVIRQYLDLIPDDELEAMTPELEYTQESELNNQ